LTTATWTKVNLGTEDFDTYNMHFTSVAALTGTVSKTATSATITGSGTLFTTELSIGQVFTIPGTATEYGVVKAIASTTSLTLWQTMANTAAAQTGTRLNTPIVALATKGGKYQILAAVTFAANATGTRRVAIYKNGTIVYEIAQPATASAAHAVVVNDVISLVPGDYLELCAYQDSGGALNSTAAFLAATLYG